MKKILGFIIFIVLALLIVGFLLPKEMKVKHKHTIKATPEQVFNQVNDFKNWENWSAWHEMDTDMKLIYADQTEGKGGSYKWTSEKKRVGNGEMKIINSVSNELVDYSMKFDGWDGTSFSSISLNTLNETETEITTTFKSDAGKNPLMKIMSHFMMKPSIGKSYGKGYDNMEAYLAKNPKIIKEMKIEEAVVKPIQIVGVIIKGKISEMTSEDFNSGFMECLEIIENKNLQQSSQPLAVWEKWDEDNDSYIMKTAIPVVSGGEKLNGGKVVIGHYYGSYGGTGVAHNAIVKYLEDNNLNMNGSPWEQYITDPGSEPDPSKLLTKIYYPIE